MTITSRRTPPADEHAHLAAELAWLELRLRERALEVAAQRGGEEKFDEFAGMYVSEQEIARMAAEHGDSASVSDDQRIRVRCEQIIRAREELNLRVDALEANGGESRLQRLARQFGLSSTDVRVLVCCLSADWELRFQRYFAYLQNDVGRRRPTIQLLGELCCGAGDGAYAARALLSPDAPLRRERLLAIAPSGDLPFPARQPVVAEAVADFLAGTARPDALLAGVVTISAPRMEWPAGSWYARHRQIVASVIEPLMLHEGLPTAYVWGVPGSGRSLVTNALAARAGVKLMRADCRAWTAAGTFSREAVRALRRDALMHGCLIELARCEALLDPSVADARAAIEEFLGEHESAGIVLTGTTPGDELRAALGVPIRSFEIRRPDLRERADLWQEALAARGWECDTDTLDSLSSGFRFVPREIRRALDHCDAPADEARTPAVDRETLIRACRESSRHSIHRFARRIVPRRSWDDLVLPEDSRLQLEEICAGARGRRRVHEEWGFERTLALGSGLNVLFAGPSGVGKTMSAEIVAGELGLDLYAVDLSCVVSKYIGETEKNLSVVFDEAETSNCVLFFDECDALFGKRTEIKDSHDRYANIEVNYLLQRIDTYEGIVILATNLRSNLDAAFTRRIRYAVEFPFPEVVQREQIWRKVFPTEAPVAGDVDLDFLARQFKLTGGSIRNVAVNAAFLAASNGGCVNMKHVIHATRRELQKMGKSCTKTEFGRYFPWVRATTAGGGG